MFRTALTLFMAALVAAAQQPKQTAIPTPPMSMGVLAISSTQKGTIYIDGQKKIMIVPDKIVTMRLVAGQHFVDLRDNKGQKLWDKTISVPINAQVAEKIQIAEKKRESEQPLAGAAGPFGAALTRCDELQLLNRYQEAMAACFAAESPETMQLRGELDAANKLTDPPAAAAQLKSAGALKEVSELSRKALERQITDAHKRAENKACVPQDPNYSASWATACAYSQYQLGEQENAFAFANAAIASFEKKTGDNEHGSNESTLSLLKDLAAQSRAVDEFGLGRAYVVRACVKFALGSGNGALSDIDAGLDHFANARRQGAMKSYDGLGFFTDRTTKDDLIGHLYRSVMLYRSAQFSRALGDYNEFSAREPGTGNGGFPILLPQKLGRLIREAMADSLPGSVTNATSPSPARDEFKDAEETGRTAPLPAGTPCQIDRSSGDRAQYQVKNSTAYDLRLFLRGPADRDLLISSNSSQTMAVPPGLYRVLGKVNSPSVLPFYGQKTFSSGTLCAVEFYIEQK